MYLRVTSNTLHSLCHITGPDSASASKIQDAVRCLSHVHRFCQSLPHGFLLIETDVHYRPIVLVEHRLFVHLTQENAVNHVVDHIVSALFPLRLLVSFCYNFATMIALHVPRLSDMDKFRAHGRVYRSLSTRRRSCSRIDVIAARHSAWEG